jgi:DnaK suppressor protein
MPLNDQQVKALALELEQLQKRLEILLANTESGAKPVKLKDNQGRLSRMDEMHNQSILVANRNLTKNRLRKVIAAQKRIADGYFGDCQDCGEQIAFVRLKAYPEAGLCLDCQELAEH